MDSKMKNLKVIGHRGAKGYEPENTMRSFERAITLGCEWIEFDVRVVDGVAVVIHDETVERTSNGQGNLTALGLSNIRKLDFGKGERLPLLEEVFDTFKGRCGLQIEIKGAEGEEVICRTIAEKLRGGFNLDDILVSAFDHRLLARVRNLMPKIRLGALTYGIPHDLAACGKSLGCYSIHISREYVTKEYLADIKKLGLKAFCYTVNDVNEAARLFDMGIDGVFSDFPDRILSLYQK